jgi:hypothetical protein
VRFFMEFLTGGYFKVSANLRDLLELLFEHLQQLT